MDLNFMNFMQPHLLMLFHCFVTANSKLQSLQCSHICHVCCFCSQFHKKCQTSSCPMSPPPQDHGRLAACWSELKGNSFCSFYPKLVYQNIFAHTHDYIYQHLPTCDSLQVFGILTLARVLLVQPGLFLFLGRDFGVGRVFGVVGGGLHHFFFCGHFWSEGRHLTPAQVCQCLDR